MADQTQTSPMNPLHDLDEHRTLTEAAKIAPGRPSTNCMWRWCRRGVLSRTGERVHLRHVRIGGKIFTTARWLDEFGNRLTEADAAHFRLTEDETLLPPAPSYPKRRRQRFEQYRRETIESANRELDDAGF